MNDAKTLQAKEKSHQAFLIKMLRGQSIFKGKAML